MSNYFRSRAGHDLEWHRYRTSGSLECSRGERESEPAKFMGKEITRFFFQGARTIFKGFPGFIGSFTLLPFLYRIPQEHSKRKQFGKLGERSEPTIFFAFRNSKNLVWKFFEVRIFTLRYGPISRPGAGNMERKKFPRSAPLRSIDSLVPLRSAPLQRHTRSLAPLRSDPAPLHITGNEQLLVQMLTGAKKNMSVPQWITVISIPRVRVYLHTSI